MGLFRPSRQEWREVLHPGGVTRGQPVGQCACGHPVEHLLTDKAYCPECGLVYFFSPKVAQFRTWFK